MSGTALKRLLSRAQMRLADRSGACEGPGWARTEHMQQESGYVGGVPKMATGAEAFLEDAGCWQASLQNARELLAAAGARGRARVGGSGRRVDCPRAWLAPGSPEEGTTLRPAKEGWRWRASLAFVTCGAALGCSLEAVVECGGTQTGSSCRIHFNRFTEYISTAHRIIGMSV